MLYTRGEASRCFYAGRSTQHQRIERLWRDVRRVVSNFYKTIFYFFVSQYGLDFDNVHVVFCIDYLFLPRINDDLNRFRIAWNSHRIRTNYCNRSPNQLLIMNQHLTQVIPPALHEDEFGVDGVIDDNEDDNTDFANAQVMINAVKCPLSEPQLHYFQANAVPSLKMMLTQQKCGSVFSTLLIYWSSVWLI